MPAPAALLEKDAVLSSITPEEANIVVEEMRKLAQEIELNGARSLVERLTLRLSGAAGAKRQPRWGV